jgi:light-regulated signal transduction histidine kinase (bacteriophytochrome)
MRDLIDALLNYSRLSTREMPFETVDMKDIIQAVLSNLETRIEETHATIEIGNMPTIEADRQQMIQLIQNLMGNALKFHRKDVPPFIKIHSQSVSPIQGQTKRTKKWEIRMEDNGIGFDVKYIDRIFQPFQRLHGRTGYDGVGMGLAICRKIIERHKGTVMAESTEGKGSIFSITLPAKQE